MGAYIIAGENQLAAHRHSAGVYVLRRVDNLPMGLAEKCSGGTYSLRMLTADGQYVSCIGSSVTSCARAIVAALVGTGNRWSIKPRSREDGRRLRDALIADLEALGIIGKPDKDVASL